MNGPKTSFTEGNYRAFFGMAIDTLVKPWEKMLGIMKYSEVSYGYNTLFYPQTFAMASQTLTSTQLGAVRLDRDIRAVVGYLSSQTVFGTAREKFQRLFQISTLLNLDAVRYKFRAHPNHISRNHAISTLTNDSRFHRKMTWKTSIAAQVQLGNSVLRNVEVLSHSGNSSCYKPIPFFHFYLNLLIFSGFW